MRGTLVQLPNFRDVGGRPTRDGGVVARGVLYRSMELSGLEGTTAADFESLGIRTVYDLRTEEERAAHPDRLPIGCQVVALDILRDSPGPSPVQLMGPLRDPAAAGRAFGQGRAIEFFEAKYREFVTLPSALAGFGRLFRDLADADHRPALIHCNTGKDRTGWAAAALLLFVGVSPQDVMADYLASGIHLRPVFQPFLDDFAARGGDPEVLRPLAGVRASYLEAGLAEMRRSFGSVEGYFADGLGIDREGRRAIREAMLEHA